MSVVDIDGTPQSGIAVYAFNGTTYMNFSKTTDEYGQAVFTLPEGDYRFRADAGGTQCWSSEENDCTLPGCTATTVTTSKPVTVSVVDSYGTPQVGLNVYAFNGTTYAGYSKVSDEYGNAVFYLPAGDYRFRADREGTQFWSAEENTCTLPGCENAIVTVTLPVTVTVVNTDGAPAEGLNIYAFDGTTYKNYSKVTDENGQAVFSLPEGDYHFRADLNGTQFWSADENTCTLPGCISDNVIVTKPVSVTVKGEQGNPYADLNVYAFDGETYSGYSGVTDGGGHVTFTLPQGDYHFRADYDGVQFWSNNENSCTIPGCEEDSVILPGGTGEQEVSIDYTYDALNRLISAEYSNGTAFGYTYDAAGNVLTYAETHYGQTTVTTYTYDAANQLLTAVEDETVWQYSYDGNGSLIQTNPGAEVANGSTRYTYSTAGYLTKVENYTTEWQTQSEMTYDGLGNRLEVTTYTDGEGNTTRYVLDGGTTLTEIGAERSIYYLYGRGVIGTFSETWNYILSDGAGSTRQLVDEEGAVNLSVSYTPWGDTMEIYGSGMLNLGYMGGVYDAGTGLIYMGNGQYYDPSTGRFLTRGAQQGQSNPYTPWNSDPAGMLIAPLALLALVFGRKKTRTKFDQFVILFVIVLSIGLSVSAFAWVPTSFQSEWPPVPGGTQPSTGTPTVPPPPTSANAPAYTVDPQFEETFYTVYLEPMLVDDCNRTDQRYKDIINELLTIISSVEYSAAVLQGRKPDYRGIFIATYYKKEIENYSEKYTDVTPLMVAVGIAIQGNYSGNIGDVGQEVFRFLTNAKWSENDAFGIAQATFSEVEGYAAADETFDPDVLDPRNDLTAIQTMVERIHRVTQDERIQKCPVSDQMIFAIIAQQNKGYTVNDAFHIDYKTGAHPFYNIYSENSYSMKWSDYFRYQYEHDQEEGSAKDRRLNNNRAGGRDFMTQFMLQRAVNNMEIFVNNDIFDLPLGMNNSDLVDMKELADIRWNQ